MNATILFPSDYFSLRSPNENYFSEFEAVVSTEGLEAALFNFDEYIEGASLVLNEDASTLPKRRGFDIWLRHSRMSRQIKNWSSQAAPAIRIPLWRN